MSSVKCRCGVMVDVSAVPAHEPWATCLDCGRLVRVDTGQAQIAPRPDVPKAISVDDRGGQLEIVRRWFQPAAFFLLFFCGIWDSVVGGWMAGAIASGAWGLMLFGSIHTLVGVFLTYVMLTMFMNRTRIRVKRGELSIRHGPLPWVGNGTYPVHDLKQLFTKEKVTTNKKGEESRSYELHVIDASGAHRKLLSGLPNPEQAWFIESEIERYLGIEDAPVDGEHKARTAQQDPAPRRSRKRRTLAQKE